MKILAFVLAFFITAPIAYADEQCACKCDEETGGTFTVEYAGFATPVTQDWAYVKRGTLVTLWPTSEFTAASNSTNFQTAVAALPAEIRPTSVQTLGSDWPLYNSGVTAYGGARIYPDGTLKMCIRSTFDTSCTVSGGFFSSGAKGMPNKSAVHSVTYSVAR